MLYYAPVAAAALGYLLYHFSQRLTPSGVHPFLTVGLSFALASALSLAIFAATRAKPLADELKAVNWTAAGVGCAVVVIEAGFLLAYRWGWPVGVTSLTVAAAQTVLLLPLGYLALGERLSAQALLGAALCLAGLALICLAPGRAHG